MKNDKVSIQIREFRQSLGITIREFARRIRMCAENISRIERFESGVGRIVGNRIINEFPELNVGPLGELMTKLNSEDRKIWPKNVKRVDERNFITCPACGGKMVVTGDIAMCTVNDKIVGNKRIRGCSAVGVYCNGKVVLG